MIISFFTYKFSLNFDLSEFSLELIDSVYHVLSRKEFLSWASQRSLTESRISRFSRDAVNLNIFRISLDLRFPLEKGSDHESRSIGSDRGSLW